MWVALGFFADPAGPTVEVDLPPPPEAGVGWLQPIVFLVLLLIVVAWLRVRRRRRSMGESGLRSFPGGSGVGNALHDLGAMLMPNRPDAVLIQRLEEQGPPADEHGDGRDPEAPP